jgi:hypothetical protein
MPTFWRCCGTGRRRDAGKHFAPEEMAYRISGGIFFFAGKAILLISSGRPNSFHLVPCVSMTVASAAGESFPWRIFTLKHVPPRRATSVVGTTQISAVMCCNYNYVRQILCPTPLGTATATSTTHGDCQATIAGKHRITPKLIKRKLNKLQYRPTKGGPNSQAFGPFCKALIKEKKQLGQHEILGEETAQEEEKDPDQ